MLHRRITTAPFRTLPQWRVSGHAVIFAHMRKGVRVIKMIALVVLALAFIAAGVNHFVNPTFYVKIMPAYLPAHLELVYVSGVFEILGGVAVLIPRIRGIAGWGLVLLLIAVFPANLHMALNPELYPGLSRAALYARLPLQALLIAWAYWATRPDTTSSHSRA